MIEHAAEKISNKENISLLQEINFMSRELDTMTPFLDRLIENSFCICPTKDNRIQFHSHKN